MAMEAEGTVAAAAVVADEGITDKEIMTIIGQEIREVVVTDLTTMRTGKSMPQHLCQKAHRAVTPHTVRVPVPVRPVPQVPVTNEIKTEPDMASTSILQVQLLPDHRTQLQDHQTTETRQ